MIFLFASRTIFSTFAILHASSGDSHALLTDGHKIADFFVYVAAPLRTAFLLKRILLRTEERLLVEKGQEVL